MGEQSRINILRCRCFEPQEKLFFPENSGGKLMLAVLTGWLKLEVSGESIVLAENNLLLRSERESLTILTDESEKATVLLIEFFELDFSKGEIYGKIIPLGKTKRRYIGEIVREMSRDDGDSAELIYERGEERGGFGEQIIIENALSSLLVRITRDLMSGSGGDSIEDFEIRNKAQAVRRYLYENYKTRITLDSLCFIFRSNKTTICKQFKEEYGMTVLSYLNSLKIKEARRLLLEERLSVTEIADELGFESIHYFTRFFKKTTGQTPTEYVRTVGGRRKWIGI